MTEPFSFQDRRGRKTSATRGGVVLTPPPSSEVANAHNRSLTAQMNRSKLASGQRTAANLQMALPKTRQPLGSLMDKGIPFNTEDPKELSEARKLCNTPDAPVWMGDYSFKPIGEIQPGEEVIGWTTEEQDFSRWGKGTHTRRKRILVKSTVLAVNRRMAPEVVKITFESGKTIKCTPDHEWLRYYPPNADGYITNGGPGNIERSWSKTYDSEYAPLQVGSVARFVMGQTEPLTDPEKLAAAHYLAGIIDGEGCWRNSTITFAQSQKVNPGVVERIDKAIETLGLSTYRYERVDRKSNNLGYQQKDFIVWDLSRAVGKTFSEACTDSIRIKNRQQLVDLYNWTHPAKMDIERMDKALLSSRFGVPDTVVSIESLGPGEVVSMQTTTGNYTAWGYASKNCRLYYRTHDLVPLLIDIYAKFPVVGLEFQCLAAETKVVTSEGTRPISELSGGVHRILTTGGKWVEAPFKSFGEQPLMRVVVQRNGRQREFFATPNHRWFVRKVDHNKNYCGVETHTSDLEPGMKLVPSYGRNIIHASNPSPFGIAHGMTFGDGSRNTSGGGCHVDLYGEKDFNMLQYFAGCTIYRGYRQDVNVEGVRVNDLPRYFKDRPALTESTSYLYGWLAGYFAADGTVSNKGEAFLDSSSLSNLEYVRDVCHVLGIHTSDIYSYDREDGALPQGTRRGPHTLHRLRFANESLTEKFFCIPQHRDRWKEYAGRKSMEIWQVISVEETDRVEEVYCAVVPGTEAFTLDGNILTGNSKDPLIEKFYSEMFLNDLNYEEFLPDLGREFFMVGEANALAHFNEELGIWSSEEILDPDMVRVSKSLFVQQERVQLLVKDMVERLRSGPDGSIDPDESPSERMERNKEYAELVKYYPEIIKAAAQDDGLDISDALISRIVNRANPNDVRGTPHLMRSFRTLAMEESLNAAQDAVCVPAGTPILTSQGVKCIEDVTTDDEVLTHRGRYRRVVRPMKREADEPGVTLRWWYDRPLMLTGEHPVYVRRPINMPSHHYHGGRHTEWSEGFLPAREVQVYDQVLHPSSPDSGKEYVSIWEHLDQSEWVTYDPADDAFGMTGHDWYDDAATQMKRVARNRVKTVLDACQASPGDILRHNRFRAKTRHFAAEYKLTDDLLWLIGLHVADGSAQINNSSGAPHGSVVISLGADETALQERAIQVIRDVFNIEATIRPAWGGKKAVIVSANSLPLAMWFREMCGVMDSKRFPSWAFGLTSAQTAALVQGWMDGDGCTDAVRTLGVTAYRHLQESAAWLMRRCGMTTSVFAGQAEMIKGWTGGSVTTVKSSRRAYLAEQGGYWVEVRSVDHHQVTTTVYNLEVKEDHSYCAPIAVHNCDRLYAPLILATLGLPNLGDGEPWIPSPADLDDVRDDLQAALAADFKLMVHNLGLQIQNVFGRESVPRFDQDYQRIDSKLLQAWGIGEALIAGGTTGTYASSALNREVCEQLMFSFQNKIRRHIIKRCEVIAEAQQHYDFELKGGIRRPLYREIVEEDPETGEQYIRRVPKLLLPEIHFSCVVPGTQVLTPTGQRNVEDIQPGDEVLAWDGSGYVIDTALHTGIEHREALVDVVTKTGKIVRCTSDHPFWTKRGWVLAQDLSSEDAIRSSAGQLAAHIDSDDDVDLCRFLGLLVGDGSYSQTHVSLSISETEIDEFACAAAEKFGLTAKKKIDKRTAKVWSRSFTRSTKKGAPLRNPLHTLLREQGVWGKNGHTKRVPPIVWQSGIKGRAAFLSGYFDADGHARNGSAVWTSVNRKLLEDCQILMESLGIRAQIHSYEYQYEGQKAPHRPQPTNQLIVSHKHHLEIANGLLFPLVDRKAKALSDIARPPVRNTRPNFDNVEWDVVQSVSEVGGGDIVTLGISQHHTHVTAGLVSHNTLNLRDESTERAFIAQLKAAGVPVSDKMMAVNLPLDFEQELERSASETVQKMVAQAQAMQKVQKLCDAQGLPYPPELATELTATLQLRQQLAQTDLMEDQAKMSELQTKQMTAPAAAGMGMLPGVPPPPPEEEGGEKTAATTTTKPPGLPHSTGPQANAPHVPGPPMPDPVELPRNRIRPPESDEQRKNQPKTGSNGEEPRKLSAFEVGPSSYGRSRFASEQDVERAVKRLEVIGRHVPNPRVEDLVDDPEFYQALNATAYEDQIRADYPEVVAGGAQDSKKILDDLLEQYAEVFGVEPQW